jgi:nucleoside-diphosphate-sugar epimerase
LKLFLTGGTGFIGSRVATTLRQRGDEVTALVRTPDKAKALEASGCDLMPGDLNDVDALRAGMSDCQAVIHAAAMYEVGIKASQREAMYEANVTGTRNVLGTALELGVPRCIYVSTVGVFGDTKGEIFDESRFSAEATFGTYYEETKHQAHLVASELVAQGLPCIIVMPGVTYGPGDPSAMGKLVDRFVSKKLPALPLPTLGGNYGHRDDIVAGILLALDKGRPGESYILGGEIARQREFVAKLAAQMGRKPPRDLPTFLLKAMAPLGGLLGPLLDLPPNLHEATASDGATFWATHEKAKRELGYSPRGLDRGIKDLLEAR